MKPVDLTLSISETIPMFPGSPEPHFISWSTLKNDGYNMELLFLSSHTGTHMDAPFHFVNRGAKIHEIPIRRFWGDGLLVRTRKEKNQTITKRDLLAYESEHGKIPAGCSVFIYTGWQKYLKKKNYFTENPGLSESAAKYLISRKVNIIGIDSPSIDRGNNFQFPVHKVLSKNNLLIVENLANLEKISKNRFSFVIMPLKLQGATGSPVRAVAF